MADPTEVDRGARGIGGTVKVDVFLAWNEGPEHECDVAGSLLEAIGIAETCVRACATPLDGPIEFHLAEVEMSSTWPGEQVVGLSLGSTYGDIPTLFAEPWFIVRKSIEVERAEI